MATQQKQANRPAPAKQANRPAATASGGARPAAKAAEEVKPKTTAVAPRQTTAVAARQDVPDYIAQSESRGSENVEMQDMVIPRIELVQALSKCLEEGSAEYIEGAKPGMFYNSVTRDLYGQSVVVCPVFFKKQHLAWRDRKKGGGFGGAFDSAQEAQERIATEENPDEWESVETAQQIVLVVDQDTGETSEAVLSCARTKMKVSRQWNSLIRVNGFDRFSRIYELFGVDETNNQNQTYKNIGVRYVDFANVATYKAAEALYNSIASGARSVKIDDSYIDGEASPAASGTEESGEPY